LRPALAPGDASARSCLGKPFTSDAFSKQRRFATIVTSAVALATSLGVHELYIILFNIRRERHLEGIAKAKAAGVQKGRVTSIDADPVRKLKADGLERRRSPRHSTSGGHPSIGSSARRLGLNNRKRKVQVRPTARRPRHNSRTSGLRGT
jgi:hypothetical protein